MGGRTGPGENVSNTPNDMDELAKEPDSICGELLELYMGAISRKEPKPQSVDVRTSYEGCLKRMIRKLTHPGAKITVLFQLHKASGRNRPPLLCRDRLLRHP